MPAPGAAASPPERKNFRKNLPQNLHPSENFSEQPDLLPASRQPRRTGIMRGTTGTCRRSRLRHRVGFQPGQRTASGSREGVFPLAAHRVGVVHRSPHTRPPPVHQKKLLHAWVVPSPTVGVLASQNGTSYLSHVKKQSGFRGAKTLFWWADCFQVCS